MYYLSNSLWGYKFKANADTLLINGAVILNVKAYLSFFDFLVGEFPPYACSTYP